MIQQKECKTHNNMKLRAYLDTLPRGETVKFATACGIGAVYLSQLAARLDDRYPSPALCVTIERESGFLVTRQELRPTDWHLIWPELALESAGTDGIKLSGRVAHKKGA